MPSIENPIMLDFPDSFETERLIIRAPRAGDGTAVNDAVRESHEHLKPWMPWAQTIPEVEETEEFLRHRAVRWILREDLGMLLFRKSDGLYVGGSGLHRIDWSVPAFEIGYWVRASLEGQGYIIEAVKGITNFGFDLLGAERIEIRCDTRNGRSASVAQRTGYTLEGTLRHNAWANDGTIRDTHVFSMIRPEWETTQKASKGRDNDRC
jgi:RimJ/RimL family protein N-acetyltransferase